MKPVKALKSKEWTQYQKVQLIGMTFVCLPNPTHPYSTFIIEQKWGCMSPICFYEIEI